MPLSIAILGIGAMGCLFGAKLTPHAEVTLLGKWDEQIHTLQHAPLLVKYPDGSSDYIWVNASNQPQTVAPVDIALILTKSSKTRLAAEDAQLVLKPDGLAITLQNGLDNYEILADVVGAERANLGVTAQGATLEKTGVLRYGGNGETYLATRPAIAKKIDALAELFDTAGLSTTTLPNIDGVIWGKLAVNAAINPLSCLFRQPNGALVESTHALSLLHQAAHEVELIAHAQDITLPYPDAAQQAEHVARLTSKNYSSMLQDVLRGSETEIEYICGAVLRRAEKLGIPTPTNLMFYRLVKALDDMRGLR